MAEGESRIKFPAVGIKDTFDFYSSENSLRRCTKAALKNGWYRDLKVLDAAGVLHTISDAKFVRDTGQKTYRGLFASTWIEVEPKISAERQLDLDEARRLIRRGLTLNRDFWESSGYDFSALLNQVERAESMDEIWKILIPLLTAPLVDPGRR